MLLHIMRNSSFGLLESNTMVLNGWWRASFCWLYSCCCSVSKSWYCIHPTCGGVHLIWQVRASPPLPSCSFSSNKLVKTCRFWQEIFHKQPVSFHRWWQQKCIFSGTSLRFWGGTAILMHRAFQYIEVCVTGMGGRLDKNERLPKEDLLLPICYCYFWLTIHWVSCGDKLGWPHVHKLWVS